MICPTGLMSKNKSVTCTQETNTTPLQIETQKINYNGRLAFNIIKDHFLGTNNQLFMIITGLGGSGKSSVIQAVTNPLNEKCKIYAYFGSAAFNVKGNTLHLLLKLPIRGKKNGLLQSSALARLQTDLKGVKYLISNFPYLPTKYLVGLTGILRKQLAILLCQAKMAYIFSCSKHSHGFLLLTYGAQRQTSNYFCTPLENWACYCASTRWQIYSHVPNTPRASCC